MANKRINIQEILENVIEIPETPLDYLVTREEYDTFYQRGSVPFDGTQAEYDFYAQKAYQLVDNASSHVLKNVGADQLLDVYQEVDENEEPIGPIKYGPLFFLKKAIASQTAYT